MARQQIDIGVEGNDGTGDSIRESFRKVNENFGELYAVFGIGGQISFTDLSDTPDSYEGNENKVPTVKSDGSGINLLELASDNSLDGSVDTIGFDFSVDGKLIIRQLVSKVSNDPEPILGGPLNAATQPIAGVTVSQDAIDTFNSVYGTDYTTSDLVINKSFADRNYQAKEVAGGGLRLGDEPTDISEYILTADTLTLGNLTISDHGLSDAYNGAPFVFRSTGTDPFGVDTESVYYIRIQDGNTISLHPTEQDALEGTGRILLSGGTGTFTITDAAYDISIPGNWLSNVALPRKSIVRRQGDTMTGALHLHDHPGEVAGKGTPNGYDDLQAATKLYVDNVAATSEVNLYVSTTGSDRQEFTPDGKEGRSPGYAFKTINAAARKAEEIIEAAPYEPGPYMMDLTYNSGEGTGTVVTAGISSPIAQRTNARTLILQNKEFVAKEVTAYIDAQFPEFAGAYNHETCQRDVEYILDSVSLDALLGNNANYLSRWSGIRYYSNVSAQKAIGVQKSYTVAGIEYAKTLVTQYILTNTAPPTLYQDRVEQYIEPAIVPDASADESIGAKFDIILEVIDNGVLDAPTIVDGQTNYKINVNNGNFGFIDQANPENTDIIPGKVVRGKNSGAIGRIIDYKHESGPRAVSVASTDEIEIQLLKPIEFEDGEVLEYGNIVRETQVTIRVETGIYEEDYPIKLPANCSVKGDEFRRTIIRPKKRVSQSRWANTFFYRDAEFDGLILGKSSIETLNVLSPADSNRTAGTYTVSEWTSDGLGKKATFEVTVSANGAVTDVTVVNAGTDFVKNEVITISDDDVGGGGAADVLLEITKVPNGIEYVNPLSGDVDGYFGYHYLLKPDQLKNTGAGYENVGNWDTAALALVDNREFIQEQVVEYIENEYPALIGVYSRTKCARDVGLIVDALINDLRNGGNEFSLEAQGEYYAGAVEAGTEAETVAGIEYIATIAKRLVRGLAPSVLYGTAPEYTFDDFNGDGDPAEWSSGVIYRLGNVVKYTFGGLDRYYTPTIEHTSGETFDAGEIAAYWREIDGPAQVIDNLIDTVAFAFNTEYNPPLRNEEMDVFLMNDATMLRNVTVQGHGGFMLVLDPEGQVLTKSPYIQTGTSFSQSINKQAFRGGMFVDAFVGNSAVQVTERVDGSPFRLRIQSLGSQDEPQGLFVRRPQTPCAFYIDGRRFQVNAVTNYDPDFGTAELILDPSSNSGEGFSGKTSELVTGVDLDSVADFEFDEDKCARDTRLILDGVGADLALGTNYNSVTNGLAYRRGSASVVIDDQKTVTTNAIEVGKQDVLEISSVAADAGISTTVTDLFDEVIDIISNGVAAADAVTFSDPGVDTNKLYAREQLQANRDFIATELTDWIDSTYPTLDYNVATCQRDVKYIVDALSYDVQYGGNTATITNARAYFDEAVSVLPTAQKESTEAAMGQLASIVSDIVLNLYAGQTDAGNAASATEAAEVQALVGIIEVVIADDSLNSLPTEVSPDVTWAASSLQTVKNDIANAKEVITNNVVESVPAVLPITLQTAGNRAILGNDFTQVNDLGYGLIAVNGALSEMVSMFTYYCWTSYYAKNGSQIRSVTGSSCYGEYGLVAEGSDPNEIPDNIFLTQDMVQSAKTFTADVILHLTGPVVLQQGDVIEQLGTEASATVAVDTSQAADGGSGSTTIYLTGVSGAFDTTNQLTITGPITGDSTVTALGANSVPKRVNSAGYSNTAEELSLYVYDMKDIPSNRSEIDLYHPGRPAFGRYEVANVEKIESSVGSYNVGATSASDHQYTFVAGPDATGSEVDGAFILKKTIDDGYTVEIQNGGTGYGWHDSFTVDGALLGGQSGVHDATVEVEEVDGGDSSSGAGVITQLTVTGTPFIEPTTPKLSGTIYKLNFSTSDAQFSDNGLLEDVPFNVLIQYRRNQTHIISDLARPDVLTIRPSTALIFKENPDFVYRSISFLTSDSIGNELPDNTLQAGFDSSYDYIRLIVDSAKAQETDLAGAGTTKGSTAGDVRIAVLAVNDENEIFRLNNNTKTPEANRPLGWTDNTLAPAPIIVWQGKKHYVYNYRGVADVGGVETEVAPAEDNLYAIVDLEDTGETINSTDATGLYSSVVLGSELVTLRAGLQAGALGDVTVNISTCRATGHDFLDIGTGGYTASNYPNVIFGEPLEKDESKEVSERTKGRVFYVSTDQNGIFRVGKYFSVDQGTGTVTFSASIALSDVDGLGFKRGVVVTEFSTDTAMTDNASDTVPTELAVRGYVNRRLGYDRNGNPVANKIGPGVLAPNGAVPMTDDLNAAGNTITNLKTPETASDAATKAYVDAGGGSQDEIKDLRSVEYNDYDEGQLLVSTGYKKLIIDAGSVVGGVYEVGDSISGTITGATGTVVDVKEAVGIEGDIIELTYEPLTGEFSDGKPSGESPDPDVVRVLGGAEGLVVDGPVDEWANGVNAATSDVTISTQRFTTVVGSEVTERYQSLDIQLKANTIVNADVNSNANIAQSKLNLNAAGTRASASAISQADLGVAAFDNKVFTTTNGWVTIENGQLPLEKIKRISDGHVLGNWSGDSSDNDIDELPFSTVIQEGGGLADADFTTEILAAADPGEALIKTGEGTYGISNVTNAGEVNSILKTDANGSIQVNSVILGGDSSYEVLALDTLDLVLKTPSQGEILRAVGGSSGATVTYPIVQIPGAVEIGGTDSSQSVLQNTSTLNGEKTLGVDWIYSSFIEAPGEKGSASTGLAIGAGTGVTTNGQIAIITADSVTSSSVSPMRFSSDGATPDTDDTYDIGSATLKYANIYATLFRGTATESYYADLAENYTADADYEPGTVLIFGGDEEVTVTNTKDDRRVAGVVTTNPAHLMNSELEAEHVAGIALQGRVPCKVLGKVEKGDILVTSAIPGYAIVNNDPKPGTIIGKALESKNTSDKGVIEVVVGKH